MAADNYQIIAGTKDDVETGVRLALKDGWMLHGSLCMTGTPGEETFAQALTLPGGLDRRGSEPDTGRR